MKIANSILPHSLTIVMKRCNCHYLNSASFEEAVLELLQTGVNEGNIEFVAFAASSVPINQSGNVQIHANFDNYEREALVA